MEDPEVTKLKANKDSKEYVLQAVKRKGKLLEFAIPELQDDEEVVRVALEQDGEAMEFASERIKDNKEIQKRDVEFYTKIFKI